MKRKSRKEPVKSGPSGSDDLNKMGRARKRPKRKPHRDRVHRRPKPFYDIKLIRDLIRAGNVEVVEKARMTAMVDFGWGIEDILDAFEKLRNKHFYKSDIGINDVNKTIDFYKARSLKGENIYIHFHVENGDTLVVESFKTLEE